MPELTLVLGGFAALVILTVLYWTKEIVFADKVAPRTKIMFCVMSLAAILLAIGFVRMVQHFMTAISLGF